MSAVATANGMNAPEMAGTAAARTLRASKKQDLT